MPRPIAVLRPEPGNSATARRIEALGLTAIRLPLFAVQPLAWQAPDARRFDAIIVTSANAVRHAGPALDRLRHLPTFAVGKATAEAAQTAGFSVALTGEGDAAALMAAAQRHGVTRGLHLSGRDVSAGDGGADGIIAERVAVYASEEVPIGRDELTALIGTVALLHSPRAGARLAALIDQAGIARATLDIAAISHAAADAAGHGWGAVAVADAPNDAALIATAQRLAD
ncbi:uroporphyrinogen-III synthase [Sphingomonas sp. GlSt437]|uniref:uroporphyrinogen-III synthase n=1 Tax=Sphingomonas sp. GlSt437 TaxID=3389970 RepID=UPI003A850A3A